MNQTPIVEQPTPENADFVAMITRELPLALPSAGEQAIQYRMQTPRGILVSPFPWFRPRPLCSYAYDLYQVATVVTSTCPDYPSGGTKAEREAWDVKRQEAEARDNAHAQLQAPGCVFLDATVNGRVYVWDKTDLRPMLRRAWGAEACAKVCEHALLNRPIQEITPKTWDEMLNVLPPVGWRRVDGIEVFLSSEFLDGDITNAWAKIRDEISSKTRCFSFYVNAKQDDLYQHISLLIRAALLAERRAERLLAGHHDFPIRYDDGTIYEPLAFKPGTTLAEAERMLVSFTGLWATECGGSLMPRRVLNYILNNRAQV